MKPIKSAALVIALGCLSIPAQAALFAITFHEQTGDIGQNGHNFFDDYTFVGSGIFEIADIAVTPLNLVMFSDPEFLSFEASLSVSTLDSSTFTLGIDDFEEGDTRERGLLFDASAIPLRFDRPGFLVSNARSMCDPTCEVALGGRATLSLLDADNYQTVYLTDGTVTSRSDVLALLPPGTPFTPFAGGFTYGKGVNVGGSGIGTGGVYQLSAVPVPAAIWLLGSGLLGLIGMAWRKKIA
jgi:hypothetical protein